MGSKTIEEIDVVKMLAARTAYHLVAKICQLFVWEAHVFSFYRANLGPAVRKDAANIWQQLRKVFGNKSLVQF